MVVFKTKEDFEGNIEAGDSIDVRPNYDNDEKAIAEAENMVLELGYFAVDIFDLDADMLHVTCIRQDEYPASKIRTLYRFTVSVSPGSALDDIQNALRDEKGTLKKIERYQVDGNWETVGDDHGDF